MIRPLTSLRFFFAFIVFFSHLKFLEHTVNPVFKKLHLNLFMDGHLGVSFFFILSGFILAYSYKDKLLQNKTTQKEFWIARFARVYPLHLFTLLLAIPYCAYLVKATPGGWAVIMGSQLTLTQSFLPVKDFFYSLNAPAWSISCEAFFYFMFPYLIALFFKEKKPLKYALFIGLLLLVPVAMTFIKGEFSYWLFYINPVFRLIDFSLGILLYELYKRYESKVTKTIGSILEIAFVLLMLLFIAGHNQVGFIYRLSCYYWVPMCLVILIFSFQKGILSQLLSKRIFIILGEISFSFYLVHMLVIEYVEWLSNSYPFFQSHILQSAIMLFVSLGLSYIVHKFVEVPFNSRIKVWYKTRNAYQRSVNKKEKSFDARSGELAFNRN